MNAAPRRHRLFRPNRSWPGAKALAPADICYAVLDVFAWTVFLGSATSVVLLYLEHAPAILARPSFWVVCALPLVAACAAVCRGFPFTLRFALVALVLLVFLVASTLEAGVMPNTSLYAIVLLAALSLFFGFRVAMAGLGLITALLLVSAWGWTRGYLPLPSSPALSSGMLLDFRSPFVWARVLPIMALFMAALLTVLHFVLQRLRETLSESRTSLRLLVLEQEQRARAEVERSRQAELLRSSEHKFRNLFETANDAIFLMDEQVFFSCNQKAEAMFGGKQDKIIGQSPIGYSPPKQPDGRDSAESAKEKIAAAFAGTPQTFEWQHRRLDGTPFDAEVSLNRVEVDGAVFLQAIVRDVTARNRVEKELRESEAKLRAVFESSRDAIGVSKNGVHVFANPSYLQLFGFANNRKIVGTSIIDSIAPSHRQQMLENVRRRTAGEPVASFYEARGQKTNGTEFDAEFSVSTYELNGEIYSVVAIRDITERKRTEHELRESQRMLTSVLDAIPVRVFWKDQEGKYLGCNASFARDVGISGADEVIGMDDFQLGSKQEAKRYQADDRCVIETGVPRLNYEEPQPTPTGGCSWLRTSKIPLRDGEGRIIGVLGIYEDITAQKQAAVALQESERKYRSLFENSLEGIFQLDADHRYLRVNPALARQRGYESPAEMIAAGTDIGTQVYADPKQREYVLEQLHRNGRIDNFEMQVRRNDRRLIWVLLNAHTVCDSSGRILSYEGTSLEITARKQADEEIRRLNAELEHRVQERTAQLAAKNQELQSFGYTVSHDLKAPLRGISGYAQELVRRHKEGLPERAQFCLTQIITATASLDALIEDLLRYSRLDAETLTVSDVDLPGLLDGILRERSHTLAELGVEVKISVPPLTLSTWRRGLHQVLANLIDNAVKYSRHSKPPRLTITAEALPGICLLTVADNGIGFDMKYHDRIFGLFNRLVRAEDFEGTGAGLAIVKKVLDRQGGRIWAKSAPDQGAAFFVELPRPGAD